MNINKRLTVMMAGLLLISGAAVADIEGDLEAGLLLGEVLGNAVNQGSTLSEAVSEAIQIVPDWTGNIVAAAVNMIPSLPRESCPADEEVLDEAGWRAACEESVVNTAIDHGAAPSIVTAAAAAGRVPVAPRVTAGTRAEVLGHPVFVAPKNGSGGVGDGFAPEGGSGGGGFASPS